MACCACPEEYLQPTRIVPGFSNKLAWVLQLQISSGSEVFGEKYINIDVKKKKQIGCSV